AAVRSTSPEPARRGELVGFCRVLRPGDGRGGQPRPARDGSAASHLGGRVLFMQAGPPPFSRADIVRRKGPSGNYHRGHRVTKRIGGPLGGTAGRLSVRRSIASALRWLGYCKGERRGQIDRIPDVLVTERAPVRQRGRR